MTAVDPGAARIIAERALNRLPPGSQLTGEIVEDVDVSCLDANHVIPNMRSPTEIGIWFPLGGATSPIRDQAISER